MPKQLELPDRRSIRYRVHMPTTTPHRKRLRHYDDPRQIHELTFSCYRRLPLLTSPTCSMLLSQAIDRAVDKQGFQLIAFVYMPEHVHLIVLPVVPTAAIARLLFAIKRPVSTRIKRHLLDTNADLVRRLTIRERPGKRTFRFWQEGGGYDRNITSIKTLHAAINYLHHNPVRRGLCDSPGDWKWSSWRYYFEPEQWPDPELPGVHGFDG